MKKILFSSLLVLGSAGWIVAQDPPAAPPPPQTNPVQSDAQVSAQIRQALMNDTTTQAMAQNVRVSTKNGMVTLKGKVDNQAAKDAIVAKAKSIAGDSNVKDDISVKK